MLLRFLKPALLTVASGVSRMRGGRQRARAEAVTPPPTPAQLAEIAALRQENDALRGQVGPLRRQLSETQNELASLCYSISHDLRAPLRSVSGFAQALSEDYGENLDANAQDYLRRVCAGAQHMSHLIEELLEISRVVRATLRPETVDLSALARQTADALSAADPARRVEWTIAPGVTAWGDRALLETALGHLLTNAWKFSAGRSPAHVGFRVRPAADVAGATVYEVSDDGAGFDMQYAGKLFGVFQRMHPANEFPGNGVGLATVQRIVRRHGGAVWAEAAATHGATFFFTLPPAPGASALVVSTHEEEGTPVPRQAGSPAALQPRTTAV